jgi:hypothetical protein
MSSFFKWFKKFIFVKDDLIEFKRLMLDVPFLKIDFTTETLNLYERDCGGTLTDNKLIIMISNLYFQKHLIRCFHNHPRSLDYPTPIVVKLFTHFPETLLNIKTSKMYNWSFKDIQPFFRHLSEKQLEDYLMERIYDHSSYFYYKETDQYMQYMYPLIKYKEIKITVLVYLRRYIPDHPKIDKDLLTKIELYYCDVTGYISFDEKGLVNIIASYI